MGYTDLIIGLLTDPTKVSLTRYANLHEKKAIMQAVMANEIVKIKEYEDRRKEFNSAHGKFPYGEPLHNHFSVLYHLALLSKYLASRWETPQDSWDKLRKLSGINKETFNRWFNEVYRHHKAGIEKLHQG